jgi:hypothetical protein
MPRNSTPPEVRVMEFFETAELEAAQLMLGLAGRAVRQRIQGSMGSMVCQSGNGGGSAAIKKSAKKRVSKVSAPAPTVDDAPPFD